MRLARSKSRGYADYWEWPLDKRQVEIGVATVVRNFLLALGKPVSGKLTSVSADPPDVLLLTNDGKRIGIEVTELVDQKAVERHHRRMRQGQPILYDWGTWTDRSVADALEQIVSRKDDKLSAVNDNAYDELILGICTDEAFIDEGLAKRAVELCRPQAGHIDRAFLVLGYQPQSNLTMYPDGCPVFSLKMS